MFAQFFCPITHIFQNLLILNSGRMNVDKVSDQIADWICHHRRSLENIYIFDASL